MSIFGVAVDVHAGGHDLAFPHHAFHAAMAETFTGVRPYARAWLHVGTVMTGGVKMAKSAGNLVLVSDVLGGYPAAAVRLMILGHHWAQDWDYDPAGLEAAAARLDRLYAAAGRVVSDQAAEDEIRRLLATDLDVQAAVEVATEAGGAPARTLVTTLALG